METGRRSVIKKILASVISISGFGFAANAKKSTTKEKSSLNIVNINSAPQWSGSLNYGNLVFISGIGGHVAPFEIKAHTEIVLKGLEKALVNAGSSMDKVLKVSVFLDDIADYEAMNEVYKGRFGMKPPARTTVAAAKGGVPANSLVEMDAIAYI